MTTSSNDEDELVEGISNLELETSYEWLEDNPLQDHEANDYLNKDFNGLISCSNKYPVTEKWKRQHKIDLQKVSSDLPSFIQETKQNETQSDDDQEQEKALKKYRYIAKPLPGIMTYKDFEEQNLDVNGDMLKVSVPGRKKTFLEEWIFIPSYMRANCGLFDWSEAGIDEEITIRIIVVRPSEFEEYQKHCGNYLPIISLPDNEKGVGYARYWIQKIATSLGLEYIWMIDDDVKQFYEVHPERKPPGNKYDSRRRRFDGVFTKFESIVKANEGNNLVAISPVVFNPFNLKNEEAFVRKPPRAAVFLNLKLINEKGVSYRPQLVRFEDMFFGKECEGKNLKVIMWRRVQIYCMNWRKKGSGSPGVGGGDGGGGDGGVPPAPLLKLVLLPFIILVLLLLLLFFVSPSLFCSSSS
ncbi:uncharacterized protein LOC116305557 [Actinia tenebrosa]|uniref:Uncharacterized protein LOC116305557 n=1 Tax=Actinia tenebrosa TaxID=6105 RepID=A0A6P8IW95_ACTTE|nr:uncharacterized protein LOC116305557 [Actinia tenebrosa]